MRDGFLRVEPELAEAGIRWSGLPQFKHFIDGQELLDYIEAKKLGPSEVLADLDQQKRQFLADLDAARRRGTPKDPDVKTKSAQVSTPPEENIPHRPPAKCADEAADRLSDEWATIKQLATETGRTDASIRSAINRAKRTPNFVSSDEQPIPDSRPGTARKRYRIRGIWKFLPSNSERSQK